MIICLCRCQVSSERHPEPPNDLGQMNIASTDFISATVVAVVATGSDRQDKIIKITGIGQVVEKACDLLITFC